MTRVVAVCVAVLVCLPALASSQGDCSALSNCSGHGQCRDGVCVCHSGWGFEDCSMSTTGCASNCYGHGRCLNGTCECAEGYGGAECNLVQGTCPRNCSGHGMCVDGACVCFPGMWEGAACDVEIYRCPESLNNCTGHGDCQPTDWEDTDAPWTCACHDGFCGERCDQVCGNCPNNCSGHGLCNHGACECHVGFTGPDCSLVAPVPTCPNNCSGHGRCRQANATSAFRCVCDSCYSGADCSRTPMFCPGNCSGRGHCDCDGKCACQAGFAGVACEQVVPVCADLNYCSGNGVCSNGTCRCNLGFAGPTCNLACHTGGGNNTIGCYAHRQHGSCVAAFNNTQGLCLCRPEWTGDACETATTSGVFDEYVNGWNPIGTVVLFFVAACVVMFLAAFATNYANGKRGVNAVPGINSMRSTVRGDEYEALQGANNSRHESNY